MSDGNRADGGDGARTEIAPLVIDSPECLVSSIEKLAATDAGLRARIEEHAPGAVLLREGEENRSLFVVLKGQVALSKSTGINDSEVSRHGPGDLLGIHSYAAKKQSFCTARVMENCSCLRLDAALVQRLPEAFPRLWVLIDRLIVANLAKRYRNAVRLQLELSAANRELTETRNRLVHQEKLATLGQLVAGLAHELNNPVSSMLRAREHLGVALESLLSHLQGPEGWRDFWEAGIQSPELTNSESRQVLSALESKHPGVPRSLLRRIASLPTGLREALVKKMSASDPGANTVRLMEVFDTARLLRALGVGAEQVTHLVEGLKNYARPGRSGVEKVDLRESTQNAMIILSNLLRRHRVDCEVPAGICVLAKPGDLGQIWTNLIKNACEAMRENGELRIEAEKRDGFARVRVIDHGPGVPEFLRARIFEINYTTKTGENFGLGLGLSITTGLIAEMGGRLDLSTTPGGGATFEVTLPLAGE